MRIAHTAGVMFSQFLSFLLSTGGKGVWESALWAHSCYKTTHARGLGGRVGCPGKCTLSTFLLQKCSCPWGKCTIQVLSQGMSTFLAYQREVCNWYSNCLLVSMATIHPPIHLLSLNWIRIFRYTLSLIWSFWVLCCRFWHCSSSPTSDSGGPGSLTVSGASSARLPSIW